MTPGSANGHRGDGTCLSDILRFADYRDSESRLILRMRSATPGNDARGPIGLMASQP